MDEDRSEECFFFLNQTQLTLKEAMPLFVNLDRFSLMFST